MNYHNKMVTTAQGLVMAMRQASGMTVRGLAARIGTSAPAVTDYEKGRHEPRLSTLQRIADASGMELVIEVHPRLTLEETRSLELSRAVAEKLPDHPEWIAKAHERLEKLRTVHPQSATYFDEWEQLLCGPLSKLLQRMVARDQRARDLRAASPWGAVLDQPERLEIIARVRSEFTSRL